MPSKSCGNSHAADNGQVFPKNAGHATIELGDGKDYRDRTTQLNLPLKDEGARLAVCRAENVIPALKAQPLKGVYDNSGHKGIGGGFF